MSADQQFYTFPPELQEAVNKYNHLKYHAKREGKILRRRGRPRKWMRVPYVAPVAPVAPASTPVTPNPWVTGPNAAAKLTGTK
jgi:hypothetical protein